MVRRTTMMATAFCLALLATGPHMCAQTEPSTAEAQRELAERVMRNRQDVPDFPADAQWLNTKQQLSLQSFRGKFVLIDFWTYCCINCIHILPVLHRLESDFDKQLVVVGVHSAKFETERDAENIAEAIMRYEIAHPVVVDSDMRIWDSFGCSSWPTVVLVDPEGKAVWGTRGEITYEQVAPILEALIPVYRERGVLDETPVRFELESESLQPMPLRFPGKVLADAANNRLFVADSNHNRIVIASLDGKLLDVVGSGAIGHADGPYAEATFNHPQGMALTGNQLYVADTENHMIRRIDLDSQKVVTVAGIGRQARVPFPQNPDQPAVGYSLTAPARTTALNSPWALWLRADKLYIAMAGSHQIWRMDFSSQLIELYAGNGREDIVDGPLRPESAPYELGYASFAQPSGLASDGNALYVADSEGSSIRSVPFDPRAIVQTVVGTSELPRGRLFEFGDRDGSREQVQLQHPLGVAFAHERLFVADTYNDKIKSIDPQTGETQSLKLQFSGTNVKSLNEPSGLTVADWQIIVADTNHHRLVSVDGRSGAATEFKISGLEPPRPPRPKPNFDAAVQRTLEPVAVVASDGTIEFQVNLILPDGWKLNPAAPLRYFWDVAAGEQAIDLTGAPEQMMDVEPVAESFTVKLPVTGDGTATLRIAAVYYFCQESGEGLCKAGQVRWTIPVNIVSAGQPQPVTLEHQIAISSGGE